MAAAAGATAQVWPPAGHVLEMAGGGGGASPWWPTNEVAFQTADLALAYGIFAAVGLLRLPFTLGWWVLFLLAIFGGGRRPLLEGLVWCCGATTAIGFYGTQAIAPHSFKALVRCWAIEPSRRYLPACVSNRLPEEVDDDVSVLFMIAARLGDLFLHAIPIGAGVLIFFPSLTTSAALFSLPCNLIYWATTGASSLADTSAIYFAEQHQRLLPDYVWRFIYGSHWVFCGGVWLGLLLLSDSDGSSETQQQDFVGS